MERVCFLLQVKPALLAEYKARHAAVWPEMLEALRAAGWRNYSLFLAPHGLLVGYLETEDFKKALSAMAESEVNTRWQRDMQRYFDRLDGVPPDQGLLRLEQVFHLD